jgi:hypothetical protein
MSSGTQAHHYQTSTQTRETRLGDDAARSAVLRFPDLGWARRREGAGRSDRDAWAEVCDLIKIGPPGADNAHVVCVIGTARR